MRIRIWGWAIMAAMVLGSAAPTYADVIRSGSAMSGQPVTAQSNPGSAQGQTHRSATGTSNKFSHDGRVYIW
ncbi:hypothetical protein Sulac_3108 [Sulfobacillus acidophilus DSM 10332]|uniref:Uncharacterized protein n=1 Tax=Sulfobacillus acidophilus (strain ATCC 700253 / DSM 10332 / NAL) TaxID=679936 RepID=G8U111_SULAD|nr:hypothetical protein Sulac_3108 [Sulfobacillus acidophilus DSM 10332]